ncbi:MAG: TonB-dependent receptor [Novosphingobium sp.]
MKYLFFLTSSLVLATPALADEAVSDETTKSASEIVVLASGFEQPRSETGQAISVIGRERLDQLQVTTVNQALRTLPGIAIAQRGTIGGQTSVFVRGGNSSQTLVLIDGVRVNDITTPNAQFDFGPVLAGNIGRIEVLRGPNSIVWGNQAIGGVVNIETIKPDGPLAVNAGLEYGYADTVSGHANIAGTAGIIEASFGGSYYRTDGISALEGGERDGSRIYSLNGRVKVNLAPNFSLDFRGYFNDSRIEFDDSFGTDPVNALPVAFNKQFVTYAGANLDLADGRFRNRIAFTRTDITRRGTDPEPFTYNTFLAQGTIDRFEYRGSYDLADFATITAGAEHERLKSYTQFETDPASTGESHVTSGYAQVSLRPIQGLTLTGGVRHDAYSRYGSHTTLGGNIAFTPNEGQTVLRATYGEGFRAPTFSDAFPPFGNPDLRPETSRNLDVGIEQALLADRVRLGATYFRRRASDQIAPDAFFVPQNIESVHSEGVELTMAADATPTLHVEANYTLTNAINRSSGAFFGKRLPLRPQHSGTATIDWTSPIGLKVGGTLTVTGERFNDTLNAQRINGYTLFDLRASFPLTKTVEIYGRIENLFDNKYTIAISNGFVSSYAFGTYGRSAFAGMRARF